MSKKILTFDSIICHGFEMSGADQWLAKMCLVMAYKQFKNDTQLLTEYCERLRLWSWIVEKLMLGQTYALFVVIRLVHFRWQYWNCWFVSNISICSNEFVALKYKCSQRISPIQLTDKSDTCSVIKFKGWCIGWYNRVWCWRV